MKADNFNPTRNLKMSLKAKSKHSSQFTSPLHASSTNKRENSIEDMKTHLDGLNKEISMLLAEGLREEELKIHIEKLHEYNRLKDVGQAILGQLATLRGVRTQDVYECYELNVND